MINTDNLESALTLNAKKLGVQTPLLSVKSEVRQFQC